MSVPSSELAPAPSPASECVPPQNQRGGQHSLAGEGAGKPIRTTGEKAWHSVYSVAFYMHDTYVTSTAVSPLISDTLFGWLFHALTPWCRIKGFCIWFRVQILYIFLGWNHIIASWCCRSYFNSRFGSVQGRPLYVKAVFRIRITATYELHNFIDPDP